MELGVPNFVTLLEFIANIFSSLTFDCGIIAVLWSRHTRLIKFSLKAVATALIVVLKQCTNQ